MRIQSRKPLSPARRFLGGKMAESLRDIPQLSSYFQLETDTIIAVKNELKAKNQNVTFTSMMARLMADVLRNYPLANSAVLDGDLVIYDSVNIGIAVGLSTGVMPAVIKEAQDKDVFAISDEIKEKTERIKQGALPMADMKGSTFTISSNGLAAFKTATYILNPPETAMLGIAEAGPERGRHRIRPWDHPHDPLLQSYRVGWLPYPQAVRPDKRTCR